MKKLLATLPLLAFSGIALAQMPDEGASKDAADRGVLEEVIVTATKRSESLLDVPVSVSAISGLDIKDRGYSQFADYLSSIPGVYLEDGGPGTSIVHIRGATDAGVGSTVATYFGETLTSVFANHGGKPNLRLVDIDRVEVLRGPQGTLFGANALVGVMRIIPAAPDPTRFGVDLEMRGFTTAHSKDESYHVGATVNIPLIQDKLALRVVGYKDDIAGFIDNVFAGASSTDYTPIGELLFGLDPGTLPPGTLVTPEIAPFKHKDVNQEDTWGTRAALLWKPTDRLRVDLNFTLQDVDLDSEPQTKPTAGDYAQAQGLAAFEKAGYGERVEIKSVAGTYDWDAASLVSVSSWMEMKRFSVQDITFLAAIQTGVSIPWALEDTSRGKVFTQEVRLQSRGEAPLQWTVGLFYLHQQANLSQFIPDFSCPTCLGAFLQQDFAFSVPLQKFFDDKQKSVFGEVSYQLTPRWTLGVGGRYLEEDATISDPAVDGVLNGGLTPAGAPKKGSISEFNPSAYVRFKPIEDTTFYLQAARGFRGTEVNGAHPASCDAQAAAVGLGSTADPDTLWNYELGVKSRFADGRLAINADIYKQKWKNVQLPVVLTECGFSGILNAGDIDGKGVEFELLAQLTPSWRFNLSFAINKNEFGDVAALAGYSKGERLADAPERNASAGAQYSFNLFGDWSSFARMDYVHVGNVRVRFAQDSITREDPFDTVNARLGMRRDNLAVELYGDNIFDKRGVIHTQPPEFGFDEFITRPREIGLEVRYSF